jgi:hypothetical protein
LEATQGQKKLAQLAVVDNSNICSSALHIKLPLIKMFVKAMDKEREGRQSETKMKEGIFVGPQIQ